MYVKNDAELGRFLTISRPFVTLSVLSPPILSRLFCPRTIETDLLRVARVQLGGRLGLDLGWLVSELGVAVFVFAGVAARAVERAALGTFPDTAHRSTAQIGEERLEFPLPIFVRRRRHLHHSEVNCLPETGHAEV